MRKTIKKERIDKLLRITAKNFNSKRYYSKFINYFPMSFPGLFSAQERAFSPRRRKALKTKLNIHISFSNSHESNNEDLDSDSANKACSKKVEKKKKKNQRSFI